MRYIKIAQAAQRLEVSTKTLRRWEESGVLVPKRTPAGQRVYLNSQIESFVRPQKQSGRKKLSGVSIKKAVYTSAFSSKSFAAGSAALTAIFIILLNLFNAQLSIKTQPVNTNVLGVKTSVPKGMASVFTEMLVSESNFFTSSLKTVQIAVLDALLGRTTVNVSQVVNEIATNEVVKPFELLDRSVTGTHIAIKTIKSENIANNQITADKIAVSLVFTAGQLIDLSKVSHITTSKQGLILPNTSTASPAKPSSGEGYLAYDTNGNQLIIYNGSSWQTVGGDGNSGGDITDVSAGAGLTGGGGSGDITLNIVGGNGFLVSGDQIDLDIDTTGTSSNTSSNSGLELTSTGLSLLRGCSNSQILKWNASSEVWYCSADTGGSGSALDIQEGGSVIVSAASAANFTANDFSVSNSPSGVGLISIDYVNSKISRTDASETLTNKTIAAGSNTITGLTNTNLSGSAGITNANLANSSVTINSSGILTGGGSVSLGGTLNLTATEADTLATVTGRGATTSNSITLSSASPLALTNISPVVSIGTGNSDATLTIKDTAGSPNTLLTLTDSGSVGNLTVSGTIAASNFSGSSSGTNTGDQTITLTGDVTGTGTGSFATTIAANSVALTTDTTGNYVADVTAGNGAITIGSSAGEGWSPSVSLAIQSSGNGLSATTSNGSGLEITSGGLTMLQGCDDGQILKWNETSDVWACSADTTGASSLIVKEGGTTIVGSASAQNFSGSDFIVTDEGSNVAGIAVDYVNSKISRYDASETLTNKTIAAGSNTITGLTNSNLSGSAGITNANLANSSVTINSSGILTGGGSVSLGGTLNLTATEVDTLASVTGRGASTATGITLSSASPLTLSNSAPVVTLGTGDANATFIIKDSAGSPNTLLTLTDTGTVGNLSVSGTVTGSNLSGTNTGDQTITLTGDVTGTGTGSFATTIAANSVALTTDTTGNYVATGASGNGVSLTGGGSEGATLTAALGALTGDWDQTGAFDIALNNSSSELKILESGSTPTLFGIFDVGDLSSSDSTFTFSGSSGTVLTSANYTGTLDSVYVNVAESPTSADIAGSFSAGLTINTNTIDDAELVDSLTYTGALSVGNLTISDTGVPLTGASFAFDFNNASDRTLTIANSGAGTANLSVDGTIAASNFSGSSSGTNTGDQTITLTGDVTGTGTGSFATTIAANSVALTADTTGNYVATLTNGVGITGADGGAEGSTLTLAVDQGASFTFTGNNAFTPSTTNDLTINTDADSTFAQVFSSATNNTSSNTVSLTNSASSGTIAVKGLDFTFVGTDNAGGANTITGINFGNATAHTNNTYNGLTFGTGYTNFLTSGTINIAAGGTITGATISGGSNTISNIGNSSLTNSSVTINSSGILTGGGSVSLGGTLNLTATEADTLASVTGRGATTSTAVTLSNASNSITAGTLTATGGTINGTVIGGSTPAAATFTSLTANGDIALGDAITDAITFTGRVAQDSDLLPITATGTNDIGSIALPFDNIYSNAVYQNGNLVCDSSGANCPAGAGYWGQALGALNPNNNTVDLLIGGNATTSAKFAFKNVLTGTPTASISGTTAFVSTFLTGEGNLAVTNMADLTLGGSSTGNVVINSRGSTALTANGSNVVVGGNISAANLSGTNTGDQTITLTGDVTGTGTSSFATTIAANSVALTADTTGNYVGTLTNGVGITGADGGGEGSTLTLAVDQAASFTLTGNNTFTPSTTNDLTINLDADSTLAEVFSSGTNSTSANTISLTNTASSGTVAVKGLDFTFVGTDNAGGANTITGINFGNATAHTNNTYNGLTFGTGYTNFLTSGTINIAAGGTITGATLAAGSNTISGLTNSNLSGSAGITNANLANSSVTINSSGILTGGGSVSLGGTLNLTATEADTLATVTGRGATTSTAVTLSNASNSITAGTLTATGGSIDGTTVGASTPSTGAFTTLSSTGDVTMNDAGADNILIGAAADTVTLTSNTLSLTDDNWSVSAAGAATFASVTEGGTSLAAKYAPIAANFVTVTSNGTLTGETGIDALVTAISTTSTLNVDSTTTLNTTTIDVGANLSLADGVGTYVQTFSPLGTTAAPKGLTVTPKFTLDATDQTLSAIYVNPNTNSNNDSGDTLYGLNLDNVTDSTAVESAIRIGSGWNNALDLNGTLITSTELAIVDGGIALSELTDSGTLTAGTVDINGGAVDGTTIGATSPSTGAFTTLSATGDVTMNDSSADTILIGQSGATDDTVTIAGNISLTDDQWSISATGVATGITGITADSVSFANVTGATNTNTLVVGSGGSLATSGTGTITATDLVCTGCVDATDLGANSVDDSELVDALTYTGALTLTPATTTDFTLNTDADSTFIQAFTSATNNTSSNTVSLTNSASSGTIAVKGLDFTFVGTDNAGGANTITGINFGNATAHTNNTYNGLTFGTGYTNFLTSGTINIAAGGTITGSTIAAGSNTITGLTNSNLSGSAGITNANLANSSVTINSSGILTGGGSVSLGGTLNLTATEADTLASVTGRGATTSTAVTLSNASNSITAGTLTATGGSIDGTTVGASTPSTGAFTTLSATGDVTMNDAGADTILIGQSGATDDTVTIAGNISLTDDQWSISATGVATGITGITADSVSFANVTGATNTNTLVIGSGGSLATSGTGTITATDLVCTGCVDATDLGANSVDDSELVDALTYTGALTLTPATTTDFALNTDADSTFIQAFTSATNNTSSNTVSLTNSASSGTIAVKGLDFTFVGTDNAGGANTITGINFGNATAHTNNTYNGLTFGTGYTNFLTSGTINIAAGGTITGSTIAAGSNTITGLTNSNLSGSAGITNANLANSSVTINSSGILTGGGSVSLGGTLNLTATEADTLATVTGRGATTSTALTLSNASNSITAGTLTATGGSIDGTTVGASTPSTGAFTTLSATGDVTMNDAGADNILIGAAADTVTLTSNTLSLTDDNWSVSAAGAAVFASVTEGGTSLAAKYAPIAANFITVTSNGTLTGETGIDALSTAISTTSTLNVDSTSTLNTTTIDANANLSLADGTGTYVQTFSPLGTTAAPKGLTVTPKFTLDATDQTLSTIYVNANTNSNNDSGDTLYGVNLDNITGSTAVESALRVGSGWDNALDLNGTLITSTELSIVDGGIALSELTDSGTLTAGTVDINGGAIDGTTIGATSPSTGAFTTLSATGDVTMNDASADTILIGQSGATDDTVTIAGAVSLTDDQWSVTDAGVASFVTGSTIGSITFTTNNIADSGALTIKSATSNALTLDSGTTGTVNVGTGNNAKTIAIGTGNAGNTINIGTNNTVSDTISIGSVLDNVSITGDAWSITDAGVLTVASCTGCGGAGGTLDSVYETGNTLTTSDARDAILVFADTSTDSNFNIDLEADNTVTVTRNATASTEVPAQLVLLENADADVTVTAGLSVLESGGNIATGINVGSGMTVGINLNANTIENIGNAGTDFDSSGGLTLASTLVLSNNTLTCTGCIDVTDLGANSVDDSELVDSLSYTGTLTIATNALAVNSDSITADGATLTINAAGNVDVQDALNADSITSDAGVSIGNGSSYTGSGNVTLSSGGSGTLTLSSATGTTDISSTLRFTGASTDITTGINESFTIAPNGIGDFVISVDDNTNIQANATITGTNSIDLYTSALTNQTTSGTQRGLSLSVANDSSQTQTTEQLIYLSNLETTGTLTDAIFVEQNASGGTLTNALHITNTAGTLANAIVIDGIAPSSNILSTESIDISGAGAISGVTTLGLSGAITGATATNTINGAIINGSTQTFSANNIADSGSLTIKSASGANALTLDSGTTGTVNLGTSNNAKTIAIGTGNAGNTINVGTDNTVSDTITIGSALDNVSITGDQWSITDAGVLTVASCSGCGGGGSTLQSAYDASSGNTILTTTGRNIAFTLGEVASPTSLILTNQDTAGVTAFGITNSIASGTLTNGILIDQTGAGALTSAIKIVETSGTITDGLVISGTLSNILNSDSIDITGAGAITGATGVGTTTLTSTGTTNIGSNLGAVTIDSTGSVIINDTAISLANQATDFDIRDNTSSAFTVTEGTNEYLGISTNNGAPVVSLNTQEAGGTINIGSANFDRTINIGTGTGADAINIGTGATTADTLTFGNTGVATTFTFNSGATTQTPVTFNLDALTQGTGVDLSLDGLTTGLGLKVDDNTGAGLTSGTLVYINSVSTALTAPTNGGSLAYFNWNPASTTDATGDLFRINIGSNGSTSGNLFNITDNGSTLFSVSENIITSALPHSFSAVGDVAISYDLVFTNQTSSLIDSYGPLTIRAGESFENNNLTLTTFGTGAIIADTKFSFDTQLTLGDSTTPSVTSGNHYIEANSTNRLVTNFINGTAGQVIFIEVGTSNLDLDCTSSSINCGTTDMTGLAAGDQIFLIYDGSTWNLLGWMDASANNNDNTDGVDIAEFFPSLQGLAPGEVVKIDINNPEHVVRSASAYENMVVGIVSTQPGITLGSNNGNAYAIALAGRVPVQISNLSENISAGDYITTSTISGKAMKATGTGRVIGQSLENWSPSSGKSEIVVFINNSWFENMPTIEQDGNLSLDLRAENIIATNIKSSRIQPAEGETDISIQIGSNSTPSGRLKIENIIGETVLEVDNGGNATISGDLHTVGDLYATNVHSQNIEDIEALLAQVQSDQALLLASNSGIFSATTSASLNDLMTSDLYVTNQAAVYSLSVTSSIAVGSDLVIQSTDSSINTLVAPLKIQSLALAPIEIMGGLVKIDTFGNAEIEGNLAVKGVLSTSGIIITGDTAGKAKVPEGEVEVVLQNPNIKEGTLVFVTPTSPTSNGLYVKSQEAGSVTVGFVLAEDFDVTFNWWIVGTSGQVDASGSGVISNP